MDGYRDFRANHMRFLVNYVVPVTMNTIGQKKTDPPRIGSGVLVNVKGRHFIATARHCIDGINVQAWRSEIRLQENIPSEAHPFRIMQIGWHDTLDIGYLEIANPDCPELNWEQLSDDLIIDGLVHVIGYPQMLWIPDGPNHYSLCVATFTTNLAEQTDNVLLLNYPEIGIRVDEVSGELRESPFPATPHGFSGGGVFGIVHTPGIISRIEYKLLGIQYAWRQSPTRLVCAVPIKQWCDLLIAIFPPANP